MNREDEKESFWDMIRKVAAAAKGRPAWMSAGINLNPQHFETFMPEKKGRCK